MYAVIDRDRCVFLPIKHRNLNVVCELVALQSPLAYLHIFSPYTDSALSILRDIEVVKLYENTVGQKAPRFGTALRKLCIELAQRIPENVVLSHKLHAQAEQVPEDSRDVYLYDPVGMSPKRMEDGFLLPGVQIERATNEDEICRSPVAKAPALAPIVAQQLPHATQRPAPNNSANGSTSGIKPWETAAPKPTAPSNPQIVAPWLK